MDGDVGRVPSFWHAMAGEQKDNIGDDTLKPFRCIYGYRIYSLVIHKHRVFLSYCRGVDVVVFGAKSRGCAKTMSLRCDTLELTCRWERLRYVLCVVCYVVLCFVFGILWHGVWLSLSVRILRVYGRVFCFSVGGLHMFTYIWTGACRMFVCFGVSGGKFDWWALNFNDRLRPADGPISCNYN